MQPRIIINNKSFCFMKKILLIFCALCLCQVGAMAQDGRHHGLDYSLSLGYDFMTSNEQNDNGSPAVSIAIGKQFSSTFYFGGRIGAQFPTHSDFGKNPLIPIMLNARTYIPTSVNTTPFCDFETGFIFNTAERVGHNGCNYVGFAVMPGLSFKLSENCALDVSGGYMHRFRVEDRDKGSKGFVTFRVGVRFHK